MHFTRNIDILYIRIIYLIRIMLQSTLCFFSDPWDPTSAYLCHSKMFGQNSTLPSSLIASYEIPTLLAISSTEYHPSSSTSALTADTFFLVTDVFLGDLFDMHQMLDIPALIFLTTLQIVIYHTMEDPYSSNSLYICFGGIHKAARPFI